MLSQTQPNAHKLLFDPRIVAEDENGYTWDYPVWFEPRYKLDGEHISVDTVVLHVGNGFVAYQIDYRFVSTCSDYLANPKFCIDGQGRNHRDSPVYVPPSKYTT